MVCAAAHAGTVAVQVEAGDGPVEAAAVEAAVWHLLHDVHGHDPVLVEGPDAAVARMRAEGITTFVTVDASWSWHVVRLDGPGGLAIPPSLDLEVVEHVLHGDQLEPVRASRTTGAPALYRALVPYGGVAPGGVVALPEVALQEATAVALSSLTAPAWGVRPAPRRVPVTLVADPAYRARHGGEDGWGAVAGARVAAANHLLRGVGLALDPRPGPDWDPPPSDDLGVLLRDLAGRPRPEGDAVLRLGFVRRAPQDGRSAPEDVGRAFSPGQDVVVLDQASPPGHDARWDAAEEGVALAHEVLHALGVPHQPAPGWLMSDRADTLVHRLHPGTQALARAAAEARLAHWDPSAAFALLDGTADRWLAHDPEAHAAYVIHNLATGPGVPEPGRIPPDASTGPGNVALARAYADRARASGQDAARHRAGALAHTRAAWAVEPQLVSSVLRDVLPPGALDDAP